MHLALIATADDNLDIVVRTRLSAEPQIDRPTPGHTPPVDGTVHCRGDVLGMRHRSRMPRFVDTGSAPASINRARASRAEIGRADDAAEATTVSAVGRIVVLVNGLPAAGKSTLAPDLAAELDLPLISKDVIKEAHADVLGSEPLDGLTQREWNGRLGAAASGTMWRLLQASPPGAVLESSWRADVRHLVEAGLHGAGLLGAAEVWCHAPEPVLRDRFHRRWSSSHPIHGAEPDEAEWAQMVANGEPLGLGPVLRVDTSTPVDVSAAVAWCRSNAAAVVR